jgi:hypothetical protein
LRAALTRRWRDSRTRATTRSTATSAARPKTAASCAQTGRARTPSAQARPARSRTRQRRALLMASCCSSCRLLTWRYQTGCILYGTLTAEMGLKMPRGAQGAWQRCMCASCTSIALTRLRTMCVSYSALGLWDVRQRRRA